MGKIISVSLLFFFFKNETNLDQGNREARSVIYATAAVLIFDHVFFAFPRRVPVSNCFNGILRALTKNSLEDRMSKFHLVKKWWDFENCDFGV